VLGSGAGGVLVPVGLRGEGPQCRSAAEDQHRAVLHQQMQAEQAVLQAQLEAERGARAALQERMHTEMQELMSKVGCWLAWEDSAGSFSPFPCTPFDLASVASDAHAEGQQWHIEPHITLVR